MASDDLLMIADSQHNADMLYAVGMFVPDPFIYLRLGGKCHIVMNDMEIDRARRQAPHCRAISYTNCVNALKRKGVKKVTLPHVVRLILQENKLKKIQVPESFPLGLARQLRDLKIKVKLKKGLCFPERAIKCADEVKKISAALIMAEVGLSEAMLTLKNSKIARDGGLIHHHLPLTSEKLRSIIDTAILQAGGVAGNTIVAGGKLGCDPHERGHGRLRANEPIVIDIFPRSQKTGYFGDITRTVVKGRASEAVRKVYHAVRRAQEIAFDEMRPGAKGSGVHHAVQKHFESEGFKTGRRNGRMEGFFHGTGHGLGMEIHETPRMSPTSEDTLCAGHVVTVEPGLYYSGIGGVRLEDVGLVGAGGTRNLTKFEKNLEV
jgi:Xaa-Pro aminopeptidase